MTQNTSYSEENAALILQKVNKKGWNLYLKQVGRPYPENIRQGLADRLEVNGDYVLLPVAEDPTDYDQVMDSLERLAVRLHREPPTIMLMGQELPILGLTILKHYVHTHTPPGVHVDYPTFIRSIDSMVDANP